MNQGQILQQMVFFCVVFFFNLSLNYVCYLKLFECIFLNLHTAIKVYIYKNIKLIYIYFYNDL